MASAPPLPERRAPDGAAVRAVASSFLRLRPLLVAPFFLVVLITFLATGVPQRQVAAVAILGTFAVGAFLVERSRAVRTPVTADMLERSLLATALAIGVASAATGGLASPFVPMLFAPVGVGFAAFGAGSASTRLFSVLVGLVVTFVVFAPPLDALAVPPTARRIAFAAAVVDAALLLRAGVAGLTAAHARSAATLVAAGDEVARAAGARARDLEELGARVAHELKNPLAAIRALTEVMLESAAASDARRLRVVAAEAARMTETVEAYARIAGPAAALRRAPVDAAALASDLVALLEGRASRAGVHLSASGAGPIACVVDPDRAREALLNLVLNALEATPRGGQVSVATVRRGGAVVFAVRDTGRGMDAATLAKVGTPYFSKRESGGGTGLGVALARRTAEAHGGRLEYASVSGHGTTATLTLADASAQSELERPTETGAA